MYTLKGVSSLGKWRPKKYIVDWRRCEIENLKKEESYIYCPICLEELNNPDSLSTTNSVTRLPSQETASNRKTPNVFSMNTGGLKSQTGAIAGERSELSPMIGVLCGHFFHFRCLSKWYFLLALFILIVLFQRVDSVCPICRYNQHPIDVSNCEICGSSDNLLLCIVCGFIACCQGHPDSGHIKEHHEATNHTYAMDLESKSVYDFSKGGFVHRLLHNAVDGKMVELSKDRNGKYEKKNICVIYLKPTF